MRAPHSQQEADTAIRIIDMTNQAIEMANGLAQGLYPASLASDGLPASFKLLADNTSALKGITCEFYAAKFSPKEAPLMAINLYRIAQEAVNNAIRHGQASHITIELSLIAGQHRLTIRDNGIGFEPATNKWQTGSTGLGLRNIRYRATLLGGDLSIHSKPKEGTTLTILCPTREKNICQPA
jgi:signal transduction histidine kinase